MKRIVGFAVAAAMLASGAMASSTAFDPRKLKTAIAGPPTQVMVLGSPHLSGMKAFAPAMIAPLLDGWRRGVRRSSRSRACRDSNAIC